MAIDITQSGPYIRDQAKQILRDGLSTLASSMDSETKIAGFNSPTPTSTAIYSSDGRIPPQHDAFVHISCVLEKESKALNVGVSRSSFRLTMKCGHRQQQFKTTSVTDAPTTEDAGWTRAQLLSRSVQILLDRDLIKKTGIYNTSFVGLAEVPPSDQSPGVFAYNLTMRVWCRTKHGAFT